MVPLVPALADSVPQMVDQLCSLRYADCRPGYRSAQGPLRCARTVLRTPQTAEQLVKVPTILYFLKQTVDTSGRSGGPQGFLPGRSSSSPAVQIMDIPAPGRGVQRGLQGFSHGRSSTARTVEQNVDIPVPEGGLRDLPDPGAPRDERGQGFFFALFPRFKKSATLPLQSGSALHPRNRAHGRRQLMTCRWRSRRRRRSRSPRRSLTTTSSMWSLMGAGGDASGSRFASSIAGGWPRQTGPRLAILSGGAPWLIGRGPG